MTPQPTASFSSHFAIIPSMHTKNKAAAVFALLIFVLIGFILYWGSIKPVDVVIQAGHEGRTSGNTGAISSQYREVAWNTLVADEVVAQLKHYGIHSIKRLSAKVPFTRAKIAVAIHFDGAKIPCNSGASVGYPSHASYDFAQRWKNLYSTYFPFGWHQDNFTPNLRNYYGYQWIHAEKFLLLELGELTCDKQTLWLKPRLKKIAHLVAYSIAKELGKEVKKPLL